MAELSTLALYSAVVLALVYYLYRSALPKPITGIPYNKSAANSILGDAPSAIATQKSTGDMCGWFTDQLIQHNTPIAQIFMRPFGKPFVLISDFRETQDICVRRTREFDRSNYFGDIFASMLPNNMVHMVTSDTWKMHRKLMADTMSPAFLSSAAGPQMHNNALSLIALWREKARLAGGHPFSAIEDVKAAAMDIIWAATFGTQMKVSEAQTKLMSSLEHIPLPADPDAEVVLPRAPNPEEFESILALSESCEIPLKSLFPRLQHSLALKFNSKLRKAVAEKDRLIKEGLQQAWNKFSVAADDDDAVKCALDLVVQREAQMAKKEGRAPEWDTGAIRDELFGFLIAGHDTSSTTLCWLFKWLSDKQDVQDKLRAALQEAFGRAHAAGELPTTQEISSIRIPYLDAVIEEVHRLTAAVGIMMRVATVDTEVLGHRIPKGTDIFMLTQSPDFIKPSIPVDESLRSNTSRESKGKNGSWDQDTISEFDPERWLERDEQGNVVFNSRAGPAMPFGAGPRGCFGRKLAELELRTIASLVVMSFKLNATSFKLNGYEGHDIITHLPWQCYVRLTELA